jgi:alpha-N-arabinofuranosidase
MKGLNGLINIYGNKGDGFKNFIEFGVEGGLLKVFTASGSGNWTGGIVTLPCTLRIELTPYYANERRIRFFYNDELVYALWENKELTKPDFQVFLYGYNTSVCMWDWVTIFQERFGDPNSPNFEGGDLPFDWKLYNMNGGALGDIISHDSFCTIYGVADGRFGIGGAPLENTDIKPWRIVARLVDLSGYNGLLHITTKEPQTGMGDFVEFGVEEGKLAVFTPTNQWHGPSVILPVRLTVDISAYGENGRNITFICDGDPVYTLENTKALPDDQYRIFLYGYGESVTTWDYADLYTTESWLEDGYHSWGSYYQDDSESPVSGFYTQKISVYETSDNNCTGISHGGIAITEGQPYQLTLWVKAKGNITGLKVMLCQNVPLASGYPIYAQGDIAGLDEEMQKFTLILRPDTTDRFSKLFIGVLGTGEVWIDQISFMPTVLSEVIHGGWRRDFVDKLVDLNPRTLRWPGGILSDYYYWSDGIGERDKRPPLHFTQWSAEWLNNDVGIDEFLQLCEALKIDPVINVNYGSSDAEYAAQFVEYVNGSVTTPQGSRRAANGHVEPYNIKFWEIGNEVWGEWVPGHTSPEQFVADYRIFYNAMKNVDPTIMCIGEGGDGNTYDQSWNQIMVDKASDILNELSVHYYSPQKLPVDYNEHDVFLAIVAAPISVRERLKLTQSIVSASSHDIKLAITEYNAMFSATMRHQTMYIESTLQVAGLLNAFFEYPGLTGHNDYSCLANFWAGSTMRFGQRGLFVIPSYYVLSLYSNHRGEMKVASTITGPTFNSPEIGNVPAMTNVPYLEALVTRNLAGDKLFIALLNRSDTDAFKLPISVDGIDTIASIATVWTVARDYYLDANSWHEPNRINLVEEQITVQGVNFSYTVPKLSVTVIELDVTGLSPIHSASVCGIVLNADGTPATNAYVTTDQGREGYTDENGYYQISAIPGECTASVTNAGVGSGKMIGIYIYPGVGTTVQPILLS